MFKRLSLIALIVFSFYSYAEEEGEKKPEPLDPDYMGEYSMVLVNNGSRLMASLLSDFQKPRHVQLVYAMSTKVNAVTHLVRDAELVTAKTSEFNLQRLIRGEEDVAVTLKVYMGHLDRGGMPLYEDIPVTFDRQLYVRMLDDIEPSSVKRTYDEVKLNGSNRLLVHQIQQSPSYDHLVLLYDDVGCMTTFVSSSPVPAEGEILNRLTFCGSMKPLYYDAERLR